MSQAFPVQLLAKSGITLIMCARSRASKLDGVSAKACAEARCGECARLGAGSGRAGGTAAAHTHRSCRERERRQRFETLCFRNTASPVLCFNKNHFFL